MKTLFFISIVGTDSCEGPSQMINDDTIFDGVYKDLWLNKDRGVLIFDDFDFELED